MTPGTLPYQLRLGPDVPDLLDLPWQRPIESWRGSCPRWVSVQAGVSRHAVIFVHYDEAVFALKRLPRPAAEKEYANLRWLEEHGLPAVRPAGLALPRTSAPGDEAILITRFLDFSLPFRHLFGQSDAALSQDALLDSLVSLLVQLHLQKFYWGDCSLSNALFRRDAGKLQSHLVDAETAEARGTLSDAMRRYELEIASENLTGELLDLRAQGAGGGGIRPELFVGELFERYERLWGELNEAVYIRPGGAFRIEERIRRLQDLGFSIGEILLEPTDMGDRLKLQVTVTDRQYHRHRLLALAGLSAGEEQARALLNDLAQYKALLSSRRDRSLPLSVAALHWLEECFRPVQRILAARQGAGFDPVQGYCDVLVHKWYLSERAGHDVGLAAAAASFAGGPEGQPPLPAAAQ